MNLAHHAVRRLIVSAAVLAIATAAAPAARAQSDRQTLDQGAYAVTVRGRSVGRETFKIVAANDSLIVESISRFTRSTPDGEKENKKLLLMTLGREDGMLRSYTSNEEFNGHVRVRSVAINSEQAITLIDEIDGRGYGDTHARPAGRIYVMESQLYTLMQVIALGLRDQSFERRPINVIALAQRDTIAEAEIVRLPAQTIRWGNKPVQADHLQFVQDPVTIDLWMDKLGRVLRITHEPSGLLVEREAPKVKPPGKPPKSGG